MQTIQIKVLVTVNISFATDAGGREFLPKSMHRKTSMAPSAAKKRIQYVPDRREEIRNSRSTMGRKVI
ncbi:MAG TPA: hypothetical protein VFC07_11280 [Verrucomicrobiae bacterium]|nr:hypothetical protein [Verrucomicrobiae bacterium]